MRISQFTDYSLRTLLYLGLKEELATIAEISKAFKVSQNHMVKVAHRLSQLNYIQSFKGKNGGIKLAKLPAEINIGELVEHLEPMDLLECFNVTTNTCPIQGVCKLEQILHSAQTVFIKELKNHNLESFLKPGRQKQERLRRLGLANL